MKSEYRHLKTSVSMVNYHIVFCPRYRRKIFLIDRVENRFKELVAQICAQNSFVILATECHVDHCHLFLNVPPSISAAEAVKVIKTNTARILLKEFSEFEKTHNLWTRSYFVSTAGNVSSSTIQKYVETQKLR